MLNSDVLNQDDQFGNKIKNKKIIANFANNLIQRLFQPSEEDSDVDIKENNGDMSDDIRNNNNELTLAQELKCFIKTSDFQMKIDKGEIGSKLVKKEMALFEASKSKPKNLDMLFNALKTIPPTSVEAERAFSCLGLFATKIRSSLQDDTLDALTFLRQTIKNFE